MKEVAGRSEVPSGVVDRSSVESVAGFPRPNPRSRNASQYWSNPASHADARFGTPRRTVFVWLSRTRRHPEQAPHVLPGLRRLANPAYVVLPITGILMVLDADLGFSTFWIATAIGLYVALAVIAGAFFSPSLRRQVELATAAAEPSIYDRAARRTTVAGVVTMLPVAAILYLMVVKPIP
jgi:uncharacterized membrane protein